MRTGGALWGGGVSEPGGWDLRAPTLAVRTRTTLRPHQEPPCPLSARQTTQLLSPLTGPGTQRGRGCPRAEAGPVWLNRAWGRRGTFSGRDGLGGQAALGGGESFARALVAVRGEGYRTFL